MKRHCFHKYVILHKLKFDLCHQFAGLYRTIKTIFQDCPRPRNDHYHTAVSIPGQRV